MAKCTVTGAFYFCFDLIIGALVRGKVHIFDAYYALDLSDAGVNPTGS